MLIEFDFNDESIFQKYKVFIQYVTREIEDIVRDSDVRSHLRWRDDESEALRLDFRISILGMPIRGIARIFTFQSINDSKHLEDLMQETLRTIRHMVFQI